MKSCGCWAIWLQIPYGLSSPLLLLPSLVRCVTALLCMGVCNWSVLVIGQLVCVRDWANGCLFVYKDGCVWVVVAGLLSCVGVTVVNLLYDGNRKNKRVYISLPCLSSVIWVCMCAACVVFQLGMCIHIWVCVPCVLYEYVCYICCVGVSESCVQCILPNCVGV